MTKNGANDRGIDFWKYNFQKSIPLSFASFFVMIPSYDFNNFLWGQKLKISTFIWATSEQNRSRELGDPRGNEPSVSCTPLSIFSTGLYPTLFGDSCNRLVLRAQKELDKNFGHFEKPYPSTFDSCAAYRQRITQEKTACINIHVSPPRPAPQITVFIWHGGV